MGSYCLQHSILSMIPNLIEMKNLSLGMHSGVVLPAPTVFTGWWNTSSSATLIWSWTAFPSGFLPPWKFGSIIVQSQRHLWITSANLDAFLQGNREESGWQPSHRSAHQPASSLFFPWFSLIDSAAATLVVAHPLGGPVTWTFGKFWNKDIHLVGTLALLRPYESGTQWLIPELFAPLLLA